MSFMETANYPQVVSELVKMVIAMFSFLSMTIIALVIWIYHRDSSRIDELEKKIEAVPPIVEAAQQLRQQVKEQWDRIRALEATTNQLSVEHKFFTGKHQKD